VSEAIRYDVTVHTTPRLADLAVDGRPIAADEFGRYHVTLTEGLHEFTVTPRDDTAAISFEYAFSAASGKRKILLDYESMTVKDSE
jgi:hypothetical protein